MLRTIRFQPDYYKSAQFAGLLVADRLGLYHKRRIELEWLPTCPPGEEPAIVSESIGGPLTLGCAEQNILIPAIRRGAADVQAVAAMFGRSPLALAALPGRCPWEMSATPNSTLVVGAHVDTVDLIQRLLPAATVVELTRETKLSALAEGSIDAVQIYDVMEALKLEQDLGAPPVLLPLEGMHDASGTPARLGYAQVMFAPSASVVAEAGQRALIADFLEGTFEGWREATRDPGKAAAIVQQAMAEAAVSDAADHWLDEPHFHRASVEACCSAVARTRSAGVLGVIDPSIWEHAVHWLGGSGGKPSLEPSLWRPDPLLVDGDRLAMDMLEVVKKEAAQLTSAREGARPRLAVVTVGTAPWGHTHPAATDRLGLARSPEASWFDKSRAGEAHGVAVDLIDLKEETTTAELCATLESLVAEKRCDAIQVMWPLPPHIDARRALALIPPALDADGAHYIGGSEAASGLSSSAVGARRTEDKAAGGWMPVTAEAVLHILHEHGIDLKGKRALVIGRSRLVGMPLAYAMTRADATVTVAHTATTELDQLCQAADVVVSATGSPHLIKGDWIQAGAAVISVGKTFSEPYDGAEAVAYAPWVWDIEADLDAFRHAKLVAGSPGGVGPLSLAFLMRNVVQAAQLATLEASAATLDAGGTGESGQPEEGLSALALGLPTKGANESTPPLTTAALKQWIAAGTGWTAASAVDKETGQEPATALIQTFSFANHAGAAALVAAAGRLGDALVHHPAHIVIDHRCTEGVDVTFRLFTTATGQVTAGDVALAQAISKHVESMTA